MRDELMEHVCQSRDGFRQILYLVIVIIALMLMWLPFTRAGTATRVVVVVNLVGATAFAAVAGYVVRRCEKRVRERRENIRQA